MQNLIADIEHLDAAILPLRQQFAKLTRAHAWFQNTGALKAVSVSDPFEDGSIDITFHGVLVKLRLLLTFSASNQPLGRVLVLHCHSAFGKLVQGQIGEFSFNEEGYTNLPPDAAGKAPTMHDDAAMIVLTCLRKALSANASLSG